MKIPEGLEHLAPAFIAEMERDRDALIALANSNNDQEFQHVAHAMHGKCAMFGETQLADILKRIGGDGGGNKYQLLKQVVERVSQLKI